VLKIYGLDVSTWSNRVRFTANFVGLKYEYIQVNLAAGEGQTDAYLAVHPAGKVPVLDDDGFQIFESGAITKYLADKTSSGLYPTDIKKRAIVDQWSEFVSQHVAKALERVFFNRIIHQVVDTEKDERSLQDGLAFLNQFLPIVDAQLGKNRHLASEEISLADMVLLAWLDPAELSEIDLSPYQNIGHWRNRLKQEDFYTACHRDYIEAFQAMSAPT